MALKTMYSSRNKRAHDDRWSRGRGLEVEIQPQKQGFRQTCTQKYLTVKGSQGLSQVRNLRLSPEICVIDPTLSLGIIIHKMGWEYVVVVEGSHYTIKSLKFL